MFNVDQFMQQPVAPLATKYEVVREGEYPMSLSDDLKAEEISYTDKQGLPAAFQQMTISCIVHDDKIKQELGRDKVTVRMQIPLDLDGNGKLEEGPNKNVKLGQLREALGQNADPNWTPAMLKNAPTKFMGKVGHRSDKKDPSIKYADVVKVTKIAA